MLLLVGLAALVGGLIVGAADGGEGPAPPSSVAARSAGSGRGVARSSAAPTAARATVARMSLARQVGELLVISFSGTTPPAYLTDALHGGRAAGVILFGGNAPSTSSVRALTGRVQRAAGGDAIVSLDQEGGDIRTLKFAPPTTGQARQGSAAVVRANAGAAARALRAVGVNVTLGPVADVATTPGSFMAGRAFPGGAAAVSAAVTAAVGAYRASGVAAAAKHFPGDGGATENTDNGSATIGRSRTAMLARDLVPFRAAIAAGAPLVMVGHARYPGLDPSRIASQSHPIVTDLLRGTLGFDGVVITDSLEAKAVDDATPGRADVGLAAVRSLAAGDDLMLLTGPGSFPLARTALIAAATRSPALRARVAESAARVIALRAQLAAGG
jgi:beta-N-acetylhexosaminidase